MKEIIQDYTNKDFKSLNVIEHNNDSYTLEVIMNDGGEGLLDIDFYNDGNSVEILDEVYIESNELEQFIININQSYCIGDWLRQYVKDGINA